MTFSTITATLLINSIQPLSDKQSIALATFTDRNTATSYPVTLSLYGKNVELGAMLLSKVALVSGTFKLINKVLTISVQTICPAALPGFSSATLLMRLGKDPEFNTTGNSPRVNCFGLVNHLKDKEADGASASGFGVSFFGKKAELINKYSKKGNLLGILGKLNIYGKETPSVGISGVELFFLPKSTSTVTDVVPAGDAVTVAPQTWENLPF